MRVVPKLMPLLRTGPVLILLYGAVLTVFDLWEVRTTIGELSAGTLYDSTSRILFLTAVVRSFEPFFYYLMVSAIGFAAIAYLDERSR